MVLAEENKASNFDMENMFQLSESREPVTRRGSNTRKPHGLCNSAYMPPAVRSLLTPGAALFQYWVLIYCKVLACWTNNLVWDAPPINGWGQPWNLLTNYSSYFFGISDIESGFKRQPWKMLVKTCFLSTECVCQRGSVLFFFIVMILIYLHLIEWYQWHEE